MKISLITVCRNSASTIRDTMASVLTQTYGNREVIIVDGASTDDTVQHVLTSGLRIDSLISEPDRGIYDAMNKGIRAATGDVIGLLNSDDFYTHPHVLDEVATYFHAHPQCDIVMGEVAYVRDGDLQTVVRGYGLPNFSPWMLRLGLMPPHPAIFIRRAVYDAVGEYKPEYRIAADFDFMIRALLIHRRTFAVLPRCWVRMREGGASTVDGVSFVRNTREMQQALRENGFSGGWGLLMLRLPVKLFLKWCAR